LISFLQSVKLGCDILFVTSVTETVVISLDVFHKITFIDRVFLFFNIGVLVDWWGAEAKHVVVDDEARVELVVVLTVSDKLLANFLLLLSFSWRSPVVQHLCLSPDLLLQKMKTGRRHKRCFSSCRQSWQ